MNGVVPPPSDRATLLEIASQMIGDLEYVRTDSVSAEEQFECYSTACKYGVPIVGHYVLKDSCGLFHIERHAVSLTETGLVDFSGNVPGEYIWFIISEEAHDRLVYDQNSVSYKYINKKRSFDDMYYVYALMDPRNDAPFYIGKGTGRCAFHHLSQRYELNEHNLFKQNKINSIRRQGLEPQIKFLANDIEEEKIAYDLEAYYIKFYGRRLSDEHMHG